MESSFAASSSETTGRPLYYLLVRSVDRLGGPTEARSRARRLRSTRRLTIVILIAAIAVAGAGLLAYRYLSAGLPTDGEVARTIADWRRNYMSLFLYPAPLVPSILRQAAAFDARRREGEREGRRLGVVFHGRRGRPVLLDLRAYRDYLKPFVRRLAKLAAWPSSKKYAIWVPADLGKWVNDQEYAINFDLVRNHVSAQYLRLPVAVETRVLGVGMKRRFLDGSIGVQARVWEKGQIWANGQRVDEWHVDKVILARRDGRWRIRGAQTVAFYLDGDTSVYGPDSRRDPNSEIDYPAPPGTPQIF